MLLTTPSHPKMMTLEVVCGREVHCTSGHVGFSGSLFKGWSFSKCYTVNFETFLEGSTAINYFLWSTQKKLIFVYLLLL